MAIKAEKNLKEMKDKEEKFRKRNGQSSNKDVRPKKSYSESGTNGFRPPKFERDRREDLLLMFLVDHLLDLIINQGRCLGGQEDLGP